jgi:hypothetical protein
MHGSAALFLCCGIIHGSLGLQLGCPECECRAIVNVMMQDSQVIDIDYRPIGGFLKRTSSALMPSRSASTGGNPQLPALGVKANLRLQPISGYNVESRTAEMIEAGLLTDSSGGCSNGL